MKLKKRLLIAGVAVAIVAGLLFFCFQPSRPVAPVELLAYPHKSPFRIATQIERLIPSSWGWAWKLRDRLRGPVRAITISTQVLEGAFSETGQSIASNVLAGKVALTNAYGYEVWKLDANQVSALSRTFKGAQGIDVLSAPRVQTANDVGAAVMQTQPVVLGGATNHVGVTALFEPHVDGDTVDLFMDFLYSELLTNPVSIRTNVAIALRSQLSDGTGVFLAQKSKDDKGKFRGIIVSLALAPRKK
ncbi:MAG: hypothetical protein JWO95_2173 [Verrucomicrobiales bacterium]|nr:hypothetical protein [Verrucomicrobiales bacterium]